jgi:hypothetical protein
MLPGFIFSGGIWVGEGRITLTGSPTFIKFYTKWEITLENHDLIKAVQTVEMQGVKDHVVNFFTFKDITRESFSLTLESETIGRIEGTGVIKPTVLAWELRSLLTLEGFEVYELQENGDYSLHAEYSSPEQYRTIIDGLLWKKTSE